MDSSTAPPPAPPADPRKVEAVAIPVDGLIEAPQLPPKARAGAACKLGIDEAGRAREARTHWAAARQNVTAHSRSLFG